MAEIGKKQKLIRLNYQYFISIISEQWLNMGEYSMVLPLLFAIFKGMNDTVSLREFDRYLNVNIFGFRPAWKPLIPLWLNLKS